VTINPITASLVGTLVLHEPLSWNLVIGLAAVFAGISIATTTAHDPESSPIFG
jgi:drug/metabolite transporter (DMT)-like permease